MAETAWERYMRLRAESPDSRETDWSAGCVVPDFCTTPCDECAAEAMRANENRRRGHHHVDP